jgi:hypothetical protein
MRRSHFPRAEAFDRFQLSSPQELVRGFETLAEERFVTSLIIERRGEIDGNWLPLYFAKDLHLT